MHEIGVFEAKNKLSALLDEVELGGEIVITRRGRPVARLVSATTAIDRGKAERAVSAIRAMSKGVTLDGLSIRQLIDEGRR